MYKRNLSLQDCHEKLLFNGCTFFVRNQNELRVYVSLCFAWYYNNKLNTISCVTLNNGKSILLWESTCSITEGEGKRERERERERDGDRGNNDIVENG